jgi:hypothetical protein
MCLLNMLRKFQDMVNANTQLKYLELHPRLRSKDCLKNRSDSLVRAKKPSTKCRCIRMGPTSTNI